MDKSLAVISERPDCAEDTIFVIQVKLQLLTNQLDCANCTWPFGNSRYVSAVSEPPACFLDSIMAHLNTLRDGIPPELMYSGKRMLTQYWILSKNMTHTLQM